MCRKAQHRRLRALVALSVAAVVMTACSSNAPSAEVTPGGPIDSDVQAAFSAMTSEMPGVSVDLVQAAKKEGTVEYYHLANPGNATMIAAFQKAFPFIKVQEFEATGGGLVERYQSEANAQRVAADIFMGSSTSDVDNWTDDGLVMDYKISNDAKYPDAYKKSGYRYPTSYSMVGIGWNTNTAHLTDEQIAKFSTWEGLGDSGVLDDNQVGILNIASGGISQSAYYNITQEPYGDAVLSALSRKPDLRIYGGSAPMGTALQSGEIGLAAGMSDTSLYSAFNAGAPVKWVYPTPIAIAPYVQFISQDAPHPSAAKLFQEFTFAKAGQQAFASVSTPSFRDDVGNQQKVAKTDWYKAPANFPDVDYVKFGEDLPDLIDTWNKYFGGK